MIKIGEDICPICGSKLKYYDQILRIVRVKYGNKTNVKIKRFKCTNCSSVHRELPDYIFPYKQYEADIIRGVIDGLITCETLGYEDYPCEVTMSRWIIFSTQVVLTD